jgi:hypothetical protein
MVERLYDLQHDHSYFHGRQAQGSSRYRTIGITCIIASHRALQHWRLAPGGVG